MVRADEDALAGFVRTGSEFGYTVGVSTYQNPERQLQGMPVTRTFTAKASGRMSKRPQLKTLMSFVHTGDTVAVHSMDRLARHRDLRRIGDRCPN